MAKWTHVKTGGIYTDEKFTQVKKVFDDYIDCVIYKEIMTGKRYISSVADFYKSMKLVEED